MVKRKGRFRSEGRAVRQVERFQQLISVPHPPVKHVGAKKPWKNIPMATRLRLHATRHVYAQLRDDMLRDFASYERRESQAEILTL